MKRALAIGSFASLACCIALACYSYPVDTPPPLALRAYVQYPGANGTITTTDASVPATAGGLELEIILSAGSGSEVATVTASGAFSVGGGPDGGAFTVTSGPPDGGPVTLRVPLVLTQPRGLGVVSVVVDGVMQTFDFTVTPLTEAPKVCTESVAATNCSAGPSNATVAPVGSVWTGTGGLTLERTLPSPGDELHVGDHLFITVRVPSSTLASVGPGATLTGSVSTSGSLALAADGGPISTQEINFYGGGAGNVVAVPATVVASGLGTVTASVSGGPPNTITRGTTPPIEALYEVQFLRAKGLGAVNELTLCSTRSAGTVQVQSLSDASTIAPASASLVTAGDCPAGFPGSANLIWTGIESNATIGITDNLGLTTAVDVAPTLGTPSSAAGLVVKLAADPIWYCMTVDAGADAAPPTFADSGIFDGGPDRCPGPSILAFSVLVERPPPPGYVGTATTVPAVESILQVKTPPNVTVLGTIAPTGVTGTAAVKLSIPPHFGPFPVTLVADGLATQTVSIE